MGCDMVTALGAATVNGHTLFGANHFGPASERNGLRVLPARDHAVGENTTHPRLKIPEVRQTAHVLGWQAPGQWGMHFGCNGHDVAVGASRWKSRVSAAAESLSGPDLVRLVLERASSVRAAVDIACDLIERYGQSFGGEDNVFVIADSREAFVIEAAGPHWAILECQQTRAACDIALIRQDWQRLSRDLGHFVLEHKLWPNDGTKIDVHACLADLKTESPAGLKRWSRATLALAQQEGAIDPYFLRRLLLEHFDNCRDLLPKHHDWQGSQIVSLTHDAPAIVWTAPADLGIPLFFPLIAGAALPVLWLEGLPPINRLWGRDDKRTQDVQDRLQAAFDQDAENFLIAARQPQSREEILRRGVDMMMRHAESYVKECQATRGGASVVKSTARPDAQFEFVTE